MATAVQPQPLFQPATKAQAKLRMAIVGIAGSGKTLTALLIAQGLGGRIAVIDTERGRASKYAHKIAFDVLELASMHPQKYIDGIQAATRAGYEVLIIDSLSHAWMGKDGALELVDKATRSTEAKNSYYAWKDVTPLQHKLIDAITSAPLHIICTLRSKARYEMQADARTGKLGPVKIGMEAIQRDGIEYEFDLVGDMDLSHTLTISKSVLDSIHPQDQIAMPDTSIGSIILDDLRGTTAPESLGSLRGKINAWVRELPAALRRPAVEAVFGCGMEGMVQLGPEALAGGLCLLERATTAGIAWDSPTLVGDLQGLESPGHDPGPPQSGAGAYRAQLIREIMQVRSQLPPDKVPGEVQDAIDSLHTTTMTLEEWLDVLLKLRG